MCLSKYNIIILSQKSNFIFSVNKKKRYEYSWPKLVIIVKDQKGRISTNINKVKSHSYANRVTSFSKSISKSSAETMKSFFFMDTVEISVRVAQLIFFPRSLVGTVRGTEGSKDSGDVVDSKYLHSNYFSQMASDRWAHRFATEPDSNWFAPASFRC